MPSEITSFQVVLSLPLDSFLTVYTDQYSFKCWREACRSLELSLSVAVSSLVPCPANSIHIDLPGPPVLSPDLGESFGLAWTLSPCASDGLETQVSELG